MNWLIENFGLVSEVFVGLVALSTAITKLIPGDADDIFLAKLLRVFSLVSKSGKWT